MKIPPALVKRWLPLVFLAVPFLAIAAAWDRFPSQLATPWIRYGQPNGGATKTVILWFFPVLNVAVALLLFWLPRLDPKLRRNYQLTQTPGVKSPGTIQSCFAAVLAFISLLVTANTLGYPVNVSRLAISAALSLLVVTGNFMGTLRPNYLFGLRTPWTLKSPEVWRATNRIGGRLVVTGGLALLALQFLLSPALFTIAIYTFIGAMIAWAFLYSYWFFRSLAVSPSPTAAADPDGENH